MWNSPKIAIENGTKRSRRFFSQNLMHEIFSARRSLIKKRSLQDEQKYNYFNFGAAVRTRSTFRTKSVLSQSENCARIKKGGKLSGFQAFQKYFFGHFETKVPDYFSKSHLV